MRVLKVFLNVSRNGSGILSFWLCAATWLVWNVMLQEILRSQRQNEKIMSKPCLGDHLHTRHTVVRLATVLVMISIANDVANLPASWARSDPSSDSSS